MKTSTRLSRRNLIASGSAGMALGVCGGLGPDDPTTTPRRVLRLAHLTDVHLESGRGAPEGFARCLAQVQSHPDPPSLVVFGGDNVMNVDSPDGQTRAAAQLGIWRTVTRGELALPARCVIGNHDILGLDPEAGKKWAVDAFGLPDRYYSWDDAGWRFIVLDSTSPNTLRGGDGGYRGQLDDLQFQWLADTLADTPADRPVCVISHIPILAACTFFDGENEKTGDWIVPGAWMHVDARRLKDLFQRHPVVRLCLSGHIHLVDVVDYLGVRYACNGAVSGGWWNGPYQEFDSGYALVDLFDDGSSRVSFETVGRAPRQT